MDLERVLSRLKKVPLWVLLVGPIATASLFAGITIATFPGFPNFSIRPASSIMEVQTNIESALPYSVYSTNGFRGVVSFRAISPVTILIRFSSNNVSVSPSTSGVGVGASITALIPQNQSITIVASSQGISHSATILVVARKLVFSFNPSTITIPHNTQANVTMTLSSTNSLTGRYWLCESRADSFFFNGAAYFPNWQQFPLFLPVGGSVTTIMTVVGSLPGPLTIHLDASSSPNYYGCPIPEVQGVWTAIYNATVT